ncbi:hypothetical protein Tsubulata_047191 [Turnera subulata]|uniref:CRAL-TRIO domain-containing protein n=1 Tax=Turnera subulata TaxID=218843 RepID=A0A9Q0F8U8_9ROSI|nr:hypothetical protein Tsubulata_047191 [Turnera subulata]
MVFFLEMVKKEQQQQQQRDHGATNDDRVEAVLQLLRKQAPLTIKQEKFCDYACVERFLKAKGDNVKKAARHLRACLSWRESIGTEQLIADEFSAELAEGVAYVAGHDEESRPVLIFRIKQDYQKFHSQKMSASAFMNLLLAALKIVGEYYPGRLYKAFVIDPPSLFSYLWKFDDFSSYPRASSLRFDPSSIKSTAKVGSCSSSRFSFTVSHHFDSLKPWYLTLTDTSASKVGPTTPSPLGPALISPLNARSFSFASPVARAPRGGINGGAGGYKSLFPSTPLPQRVTPSVKTAQPRTPRPSFLQSPALFFRKESHVSRADRSRESFRPFLKFYRRPYDEMMYRSKMRPPLGGLISIVSPHLKRRHVSVSQRF